jgi:hypothetical protein
MEINMSNGIAAFNDDYDDYLQLCETHNVRPLRMHDKRSFYKHKTELEQKDKNISEALVDLFECRCVEKYSIEPHGKGHALYYGRCNHKHGYNMMYITECNRKDVLQLIEDLLNGNK